MEHKFTVDGTEYTVQALKVKPGRQVQLALARALGPLFSAETEGAALAGLLQSIQEQDLDFITNTFAVVCTFDEAGGNYRMDKALDRHFTGRPVAYWRWLAGCVMAEYSDVFSEARSLLAGLRAKAPTPTASPSPKV